MSVELVEPEHLRIEPCSDARRALARAISSFGEVVRGQYSLEWMDERPDGGCICFVQRLQKQGSTVTAVCIEVRDEKTHAPRQVDLSDVDDFVRQIHRRLEKADWLKEHYAKKAEAKAKWKEQLRDWAQETVKELVKLAKDTKTIDLGARPAEPEGDNENGYRVIDRRIRHQE